LLYTAQEESSQLLMPR